LIAAVMQEKQNLI